MLAPSIIIVAFLSIWGVIHGRGAFTGENPVPNILPLQLFLLCAATPFMVLAVLAEQHKRIEAALRELSGRVITAHEEVHDGLSQRMARLLIRLERWRQTAGDISEQSLSQFNAIVAMASQVSARLCRKLFEQQGVNVKFEYEDIPSDTPPDTRLCMFRITQESLRNVVKHSGHTE